jgi:hypothetical protein
MKTFFRRLSAAVLLWAGTLAPLAHAHDPLQAWATATVKPDGIEINMVLSSYPSQTLIDKELKRPPLTPENFDTYKSELESAALGLFDITAGGEPLKAISATVELTEESDIQYLILYPAPHAGPLHFRITYLDRILEGFVTTLFIEDKAGQSLAWDELSTDKDWLDAPLPTATPAAKKTSAPAAAATVAAKEAPVPAPVSAVSPAPAPAAATHPLRRGAFVLLALLVLGGALLLLRRRSRSSS